METATSESPLPDNEFVLHQQDERFLLLPLTSPLEAETVAVIKRTLTNLPEQGPTLGATRRKLDSFHQSYSKDGAIYLVLFDQVNKQVVGGVGILPFAGLDRNEGIGEIRELVVDTPYRGQGLGMRLLKAAFQQALELRYQRLYLETTEQMEHAQALFLRFGFKPVATKTSKKKNVSILVPSAPAFYVWEENAASTRPAPLTSERMGLSPTIG